MVKTLIAESDENGCLSWVWIWPEHQLTARPFDPEQDSLRTLGAFEVYGATRDQVVAWLARIEARFAGAAGSGNCPA